MNRGDVWWYEPPDEKGRPYLVLARDAAIPVLNRIVAVPATTQHRGIPSEVPLDADDGMPEACVLSLDNVQPIVKAWCTRRVTQLDPTRLAQVCAALRRAVDC